MEMRDTITLDGSRRTSDGYLVADARVARTGIQVYSGAEVGRPDLATVRVYRPEAEVFKDEALRSYAYRPVTVEHPREAVTADNWRRHAVGQTGGDVARDGDFIRVPMVLMDAEAIKAVEAGKRQLSMGYSTDLRFEDGVTEDGQAYDAIQTNLKMNHLAVVATARGGSELKIGDDKGERSMTTRTIVVDGLSVELADKDAQIVQRTIDGLTKRVEDAEKAVTDAEKTHSEAIAAKDKELGTKDAEIETLKANQMDADKLDQMVADRADVVAKAKALDAKIETKGVKDSDIRRKAVAAKLGDEKVKDKSDDYVGALFDHLTADLKPTDTLAQALGDSRQVADARSDAMKKRDERLKSAWKGQAA